MRASCDSRRDGVARPRGRPRAPSGPRGAAADVARGRPALHGVREPSGLHGVRAGLEHVRLGARRPDRLGAERVRGLVDGGRGPRSPRARGARLVQGLDRLPAGGRRVARERRVRRQPDRARVRARSAPRGVRHGRGDLRRRPGARVASARRPRDRSASRPGANPSERRRPSPRARRGRRGDRRGPGGGTSAAAGRGSRRRDEHRSDRPARRAGGRLPRERRLAARRRRLRRVRSADRPRADGARGPRARGLRDARPAQVAPPALRVRVRARPRRRAAGASVRGRPGLPVGRRGARRRGRLRQPRPPDNASLAGVAGLALGRLPRCRRVPRRDRPCARPGRASAGAHRRRSAPGVDRARRAGDDVLPSPHAGRARTRRPAPTRRSSRLRGDRPRARVIDADRRPLRRAPVSDQPLDDRHRRRLRARALRGPRLHAQRRGTRRRRARPGRRRRRARRDRRATARTTGARRCAR